MTKALKQFNWHSDNFKNSQSLVPREVDQEIRDLVRQCQMSSSFIDLDYQTEPSFFSALSAYGHDHEMVLIQPPGCKTLAGLGIRSIRPVYLNGKISKAGYLHHLRFHPDIRNGSFLLRGYKEFRRIFNENPLDITITSILEENHVARSILESNRGGMPVYKRISRYLTAMIPLRGPGGRWPLRYRDSQCTASFSARLLQETDSADLTSLFNAAGKSVDGISAFSEDDFAGKKWSQLPGLKISDFIGLFHARKLVGAVAVWNQQPFRQIVLKNLHPALKIAKGVWRAGESIFGPCPLPAIGAPVDFVLLDPWVVRPGYEKTAMQFLIREGAREAQQRGATFAALGVAEKNPCIEAINCVFFLPYWSIIYQVYWPETSFYNFDKREFSASLGSL